MKKLLNIFVLVAAAAMTLASCQKNEIPAPEKQEVHFTINAGIPQTKTTIKDNLDGTYTPSWNKGDEIGIFFTEYEDKVGTVDAKFANTSEDDEVASFKGTATVNGEGTFYAFYPASSFNQHYGDGTYRLDLPAAQKPTSTSFDSCCDILVAQPCDYLADGETVVIEDLYFARLMSVLKINLLGEFAKDEVVESISFTVGGDNPVDITGNAKIDYKTATIKAWNNGSVKRNVVTATYSSDDYITIAGTNNAAYFVVAPVTIPTGSPLTFTIKTENYNISKTVAAKEEMSFPAGNVAVVNLTIEEENCKDIVSDTRIWVEGFDGETNNKTQTSASDSGVAGTGVSEDLEYSYSATNCNVRINNNGQTSNNPFLYINAANSSFTASNIKISNEENLDLSMMIKGKDLTLTVEYKESDSSTWSVAGKIKGTNEYASGKVVFAVPADATSLDIKLTGSGIMYVDDIVLEATDEDVPVVTLALISLSDEKTEYNVGDDFVAPTVTAIYSDGSTMIVTEGVTFTEVDMNTAGDKTVTVSYQGKTVEYNFTVKENSGSGDTSEATVWVATSFADLKEGDQVVIVSTNGTSSYAMSDDNGTGSAPAAIAVTYSGDKLSNEPAETIVWYVGVEDKNRIFYADSENTKWLYCTSTNNGVRVGTNSNKTFAWDSSNYLTHVGTSRYIGIYNNQDWRCYTSINSNITGQTFQFFVKSGDDSETPVEKTLESIVVSGAKTEYTVGDSFEKPTVTATYSDGSTEDVTTSAEFTGYEMSAAGTYTVTVSYYDKTVTYQITVAAATDGGDEGDDTEKVWTLVTDASTLTAGDKIAIVSTAKGKIAGLLSSSILSSVDVTITNNEFTSLPSGAVAFTLGGTIGAWTLADGDGNLLGATAAKKVAWGSGTTTWSISIADEGDATIQNGTASYGRFLYNVNSPRFTTYTSNASSSMLLPQIYRYE